MRDYTDRDMDGLISSSLRGEPQLSASKMRASRQRLLAVAATQAQLPPRAMVPAAAQSRWLSLGVTLWATIVNWCYELAYEETCYDRARTLPDRMLAHRFGWSYSIDRYLFLRPAF